MRRLKNAFIVVLLLICFSLLFVSCNNESKTYFDLSLTSVNGEEVDLLDDLSVDIEGKVGNPIPDTVIVITATRATFGEYKKGYDVSHWFKNTVKGLRYELQNDIQPPYDKAEIKIYGTPLETQDNQSYDLSVKFNTFVAGTVRREGLLQNLGHYRIGEPDSVILEVLYPQVVQGSVGKTLSKSYDITLQLKKDSTRENIRLQPLNDKVLGTTDAGEKNFINRIDGLTYTLNTTKSKDSDYYDTMIVTVSGTPSDKNVHTEDIRFNIPLTDVYIGNLGQYKDLKGVNVVQENKVSYSIVDYVPPELEISEGSAFTISGIRNRDVKEQEFEIKLKEGTGKFYPKKRETFKPYERTYWQEIGSWNSYIERGVGSSLYGIDWEWEVKEDDPTTLHLYVSGVPYYAAYGDAVFAIRPSLIETTDGVASKTKLNVPFSYCIYNPAPYPKFENAQILISDTDGTGSYQPVYHLEDDFTYSVDNPNFLNNLYDDKTQLFISVGIDDPYGDRYGYNTGLGTDIADCVELSDTIVYKGETIPNPLKNKNLRIYVGAILVEYKDVGPGQSVAKYYVDKAFHGYNNTKTDRFAIIIEFPTDESQGDTPILPTDDLYPLCLKISSKAFKSSDSTMFVDENGNPSSDGEELYFEVSAGENEENRSYVGVFERKYDPYIADGAALVYYEDYYTEAPFTKDDNVMIIRPRLSDNASMTLNNGVPMTYQTSSEYPNRIGALVLKPEMDSNYPTHIPASSFPDVSGFTRRGFKKVGWSTVMGAGLVGYSTPLNGDNGGEPYKNTIENVAKWGLWLPQSASYVWPTPIDYPVSLVWYFDLDHYWTKTDISNGGTTFIPTFKFAPKSDTSNTDVTVKSDEKYKVFDKDGNELQDIEVYADSSVSDPQKNTTDNRPTAEVNNYSDYALYEEVTIPAKGYALPDSYYSSPSKTVPHKLVIDHDFAIGDYFVTGYMHDVLYKWNIGNGDENKPEHGYIIPPLSQASVVYPLSHNVVGYINPTKLISYDLDDGYTKTYDTPLVYSQDFYYGGALQSNSNNVSYGGFSKRTDGYHDGRDDESIRTRSYPLTWVSFTQAMVICNAFTEYYNEKNGASLTPAYTTDHSLSWDRAVKKVEDAISMIGEENKDKLPSSSFSWNYDTFANLEATGFRLPTYDEWEFATKIYIDRVDFANEDSDMLSFYQHMDYDNKGNNYYATVLDDVTKEGKKGGRHPRAKGYKSNAHANRTLGANPSTVSYAVANGSSYPMFLTDNYTPRYYGPYRIENLPQFIKDQNEYDTSDTVEQIARIARRNFVYACIDATQWYGASSRTESLNGRKKLLPTLNQYKNEWPLSDMVVKYQLGPSQIGLHGIGGYVSELTDRFASDNKKTLYTTNGTAYVKDSSGVVYYPTDTEYDGFKTFQVHPNVHYPNQGMRLCRTVNLTD